MKRLIVGLFVVVACVFAMSVSAVLAQDYCNGNFDCDEDVDGTDAAMFKADFGRNQYNNPCPGCPPAARVPKTGQKTLYATGDDGDLEKGVAWPNPRFTINVDNNGDGDCKDEGESCDGTVTDKLTGLIWLRDANCFGLRTWNNALSDSNGLADGSCGLTDGSSAGDWRLANRFELDSLLDLEYFDPALPNKALTGKWSEGDPFNDVQSHGYWSSTTDASETYQAFQVSMHNGQSLRVIKSTTYYVWPVRGGH